MESTQGLTDSAHPVPEPRDRGCAACGASGPGPPAVPVELFGGAALRRCTHCGSRRLTEAANPSDLPAPSQEAGAGLPHLEGRELVEPMAEGPLGGTLPEPGLTEASEAEIRSALAQSWKFVSGPRSAEYLDRLARSTARSLEGVPQDCSVLVVDEPAARSLALPSGRLLLSIGALRSIEDEAELVFVLGHELAHVASGDAARRLVALSLVELTRGEDGAEELGWLRAANDLIRLGHGPENEHRADLQGLHAVLALGYDPESVVRYLQRLERNVEESDVRVAEMTLAHPLPADRLLRVRKSWGVHLRDPGASRVNRDVFRRALGHSALAAELEATPPFDDDSAQGRTGGEVWWKDWRIVGTGVAILLLAALFLVLGLMLAR